MFSAVQENVGIEAVTPAPKNHARRCQKDLAGVRAACLQNYLQSCRRTNQKCRASLLKNMVEASGFACPPWRKPTVF